MRVRTNGSGKPEVLSHAAGTHNYQMSSDGKWAIHPDQVKVINGVFSPSKEELTRAQEILELYKKKWKLASFEYGSNMEFGLTFPIHYESGKPFELSFDQVQWKYPRIEPGELLSGLMKQLVG